jgi:hypothetical protein
MSADEILARLLSKCFWRNRNGKLDWSFNEGIGIEGADPELGEAIDDWIKAHNIKDVDGSDLTP